MSEAGHRAGFVAIVGRPNVGKSTLLNHLLGQKLSITSRKPQTTRHQVLGISSQPGYQLVYVDTPGLHRGEQRAINRAMNRAASAALEGVDVAAFVVDRTSWRDEDDDVLQLLRRQQCPVVLVMNKVDLLKRKDALLPSIAAHRERFPFCDIVPVSALRGHNRRELEEVLARQLPEGPPLFPEDQLTDRSLRFLAAEIVREKVMRQLGDELPYGAAVEIEKFDERETLVDLSALILVERPGQKKIVIGEGGTRLQRIGSAARQDLERLLERKVMLRLWVKVRRGWADDERALKSLGLSDG